LPAPTRIPAASILAAVLAAVAGPVRGARGDEPVTSDVRYTREVVRILQRRCLACHAAGGIAMPGALEGGSSAPDRLPGLKGSYAKVLQWEGDNRTIQVGFEDGKVAAKDMKSQ